MTTQTSKKNSKHVNITSLTLSLKKGRHRVFKFTKSIFDNSLINKKLDLVFKRLKCAAKLNFSFGFVLRYWIVQIFCCLRKQNGFGEVETCLYTRRHYQLERRLQKLDIVDLCTREKANAKDAPFAYGTRGFAFLPLGLFPALLLFIRLIVSNNL